MFDIKIDFDERKFRRAVNDAAKEAIKKKVSSIRCPIHGEAAKVTFKRHVGSNMDFELAGCCSQLIETVRRRLR